MPDKILVVDDEENVRESTVALLVRKGYESTGAASGEEALRLVHQQPVDLVILDVRMPGMDGIEVLHQIIEFNPDIPVVMLTGHGTMDTAIEALEYGAMGFIRKPITIEDLQISIENALARGITRRENTRLKALVPLFELNKQLLTEVNEGKIIEVVLSSLSSEISADNIIVTIWDETRETYKRFADNRLDNEQFSSTVNEDEIISCLSQTMKPVVLSHSDNTIYDAQENLNEINGGYTIFLPLIGENILTGTIQVVKTPPCKPLQSSEVEFLSTFAGQSSIALSNARLYEKLENAHQEVEDLLKRVITNTEDERLRISLELHDGPIQSIIATQFAVQACRAELKGDPPVIDKKLFDISKTLQDNTQELRRIVSDLHPPDLEKSGLISAIQEYLSIIENEDKLKCSLRVRGKVKKLIYSTERGLYYIVREVVTNIRKHAQASKINVLIEYSDNDLIIRIEDNGIGFDVEEAERTRKPGHIGLKGVHERARVLRSELVIDSRLNEGTTVILTLPVRNHVADEE